MCIYIIYYIYTIYIDVCKYIYTYMCVYVKHVKTYIHYQNDLLPGSPACKHKEAPTEKKPWNGARAKTLSSTNRLKSSPKAVKHGYI